MHPASNNACRPDAVDRHLVQNSNFQRLMGNTPTVPDTAVRQDMITEQAVEVGIRLQEMFGTVDAARFLQNNLVDINIALRVLLRPEQRRRSGSAERT